MYNTQSISTMHDVRGKRLTILEPFETKQNLLVEKYHQKDEEIVYLYGGPEHSKKGKKTVIFIFDVQKRTNIKQTE